MEYAVFGLAVVLFAANIWFSERRERRWHELLKDLLNRKMAKDFYDYVNGTEVIERGKNPQLKMFEEIEQQIRDKQQAGNVPAFINQKRPNIPLGGNREY
jgi:hypothetical protein